MTNDTLMESSYALFLESAKNCKFYSTVIYSKMFAKKCSKNDEIFIFEKPMPF